MGSITQVDARSHILRHNAVQRRLESWQRQTLAPHRVNLVTGGRLCTTSEMGHLPYLVMGTKLYQVTILGHGSSGSKMIEVRLAREGRPKLLGSKEFLGRITPRHSSLSWQEIGNGEGGARQG